MWHDTPLLVESFESSLLLEHIIDITLPSSHKPHKNPYSRRNFRFPNKISQSKIDKSGRMKKNFEKKKKTNIKKKKRILKNELNENKSE